MRLLNHEAQEETRKILSEMRDDVKMILFVSDDGCMYCEDTKQLISEVAELSPKLQFEVYNFDFSREKAEYYQVDKVPALILENKRDYGIRFYGIPSGYEFGTLLQDLIYVSNLKTDLSPKTLDFIRNHIKQPIHIQVFVTPTCPYCPRAVLLAHSFALESEYVRADMIEATEFPDLSRKYRVFGVPKTVINDRIHIEGAVPESVFIKKLQEIL
ncbi:MAG: thioredoxin family protein [Leptospiraceae bacterium]|nr:thioredoxin family protein [Leptospiraceae bacterium]MDW7975344.1 thioredoxin family protein [Leptospiraceae bacterium]